MDSSRLLELIGSIYDCVLEPHRWEATLAAVQRRARMHNVILEVHTVRRGGGPGRFLISSGVPPEYARLLPAYEQEVLNLWGGHERIAAYPLEEPVVLTDVCSRDAWNASPYVQVFGVPQGLIDTVAIGLARDRTMMSTLAFGRHESEGRVRKSELDELRILAPHLRRATIIGGLLDTSTAESATFAAALEASPSGIILVDPQMGIVHANNAARTMLDAGDPVQASDGILSMRAELVPGRLQTAIMEAGTDGAGRRGFGIPGRWRDGTPCVLHVLPLERREVRAGLPLRATAAVFVSEAPGPLQLPLDAVSLLYSLTPAEARVFELVIQGLPPGKIAEQLGSSPNTVRTHLNRVFDKTGCHRQADLVSLARNISLPA